MGHSLEYLCALSLNYSQLLMSRIAHFTTENTEALRSEVTQARSSGSKFWIKIQTPARLLQAPTGIHSVQRQKTLFPEKKMASPCVR